jgi:C4-type Zn-finger protein
MEQAQLPITCPLCGRKNLYPVPNLTEGSVLTCPVCKVKLNLHGHMWAEIQADLEKLQEKK